MDCSSSISWTGLWFYGIRNFAGINGLWQNYHYHQISIWSILPMILLWRLYDYGKFHLALTNKSNHTAWGCVPTGTLLLRPDIIFKVTKWRQNDSAKTFSRYTTKWPQTPPLGWRIEYYNPRPTLFPHEWPSIVAATISTPCAKAHFTGSSNNDVNNYYFMYILCKGSPLIGVSYWV